MLKHIKIFALASLVLLSACKQLDSNLPDMNILYLNEAMTNKTAALTVEKEGIEFSLSPRITKPADEDITVTLSIDEELLAEYNAKNNTNYVVLPEKYYKTTSTDMVIPKGKVSTPAFDVQVPYFTSDGEEYALPFVLSSNDQVTNSTTHNTFIYFLNSPLIQPVPTFNSYNSFNVGEPNTMNLELPNFTLEWWMAMSIWDNEAIFTGKGVFVRVGDTYYGNGNDQFMMIKIFGLEAHFDTGDPSRAEFKLGTGQWYHYALTYEAATGKSVLYVNGESRDVAYTPAGQPLIMQSFEILASGHTHNNALAAMCQLRLWKTTRTQSQIFNNMRRSVNPKDPDLIWYIPMNEGEGATILHDITGHGYDCKIGSIKGTNKALKWETMELSKLKLQ